MKSPQVIVLELDGWLAKQLRDLSADSRWLVQATRSAAAALSLARDSRPAVLLVQVDPGDETVASLRLISEVHRQAGDVAVVAVSDVKLPDAERAAWTAAIMDLGARYVLFPPLTRPVLEDVVSGLMAAAIRAAVGEVQAVTTRRIGDSMIDLANEEAEE